MLRATVKRATYLRLGHSNSNLHFSSQQNVSNKLNKYVKRNIITSKYGGKREGGGGKGALLLGY